MIAAAVGWMFVGATLTLTVVTVVCLRAGADADRRLADLDDPIPYDVAYARGLELPEAWETVPDDDEHAEWCMCSGCMSVAAIIEGGAS